MRYHAYNGGFTLVEALVALTLLTVGLIPAFLQAASAVQLTGQIRNSLIAAHLAQEGVEVVRAVRDANWFAARPFDSGLTGCTSGCAVQYNGIQPTRSDAVLPLKRDPTSGLYQYATGTPSVFVRTVTVTEPSNHEMRIISEVVWTERSGPKKFAVEYHLFDWIK